MLIINTFIKSEEWFYSGNNLTLNIKAGIRTGDACVTTEISYDVTMKGYKGTTFQV